MHGTCLCIIRKKQIQFSFYALLDCYAKLMKNKKSHIKSIKTIHIIQHTESSRLAMVAMYISATGVDTYNNNNNPDIEEHIYIQ